MVATSNYFETSFKSISSTVAQLAADDKVKDPAVYGSYKSVHKSIIVKLQTDELIKTPNSACCKCKSCYKNDGGCIYKSNN